MPPLVVVEHVKGAPIVADPQVGTVVTTGCPATVTSVDPDGLLTLLPSLATELIV